MTKNASSATREATQRRTADPVAAGADQEADQTQEEDLDPEVFLTLDLFQEIEEEATEEIESVLRVQEAEVDLSALDPDQDQYLRITRRKLHLM